LKKCHQPRRHSIFHTGGAAVSQFGDWKCWPIKVFSQGRLILASVAKEKGVTVGFVLRRVNIEVLFEDEIQDIPIEFNTEVEKIFPHLISHVG
jgi:hypothetical protein